MNKTLNLKTAKGDCCPLLTLALARVKDSDKTGLQRSIMFRTSPKAAFVDALVIRFHKGKRGAEGADVTYGMVNYCPFCGQKQRDATTEAEEAGGFKDRPRSPGRSKSRHVAKESNKGHHPVRG